VGEGKIPGHVWGRAEYCIEDELEYGLEISYKRFLEVGQRLREDYRARGPHIIPVCCDELGDNVPCRAQHTGLNCGGYDGR
jgi:hypothetical protein